MKTRAATPGVAGTLVGAVIGWNIPEERVKEYESGLREGGILMGVRPRNDDEAAELARHWQESNGKSVYR